MKTKTRYYLTLAHVGVQVGLVLVLGLLFSLAYSNLWQGKEGLTGMLLSILYSYQFITAVMGAIMGEGWRRDIVTLFFLLLFAGSLLSIIISVIWSIFIWWIYGIILFVALPLGHLYYSIREFVHIRNAAKRVEIPQDILDAGDI